MISNYSIEFAGDASAFFGELQINAGTFSLESAGTISANQFTIAEDAILKINGSQTLAGTLSGDGKMQIVAGTLNFSGNAENLAGTEIIGSTAKIIADENSILNNVSVKNNANAKLAGTIAGTLDATSSTITLAGTAKIANKITLNNSTLDLAAGTFALADNQTLSAINNSKILGNIEIAETTQKAQLTLTNSQITGNLSLAGTTNLVSLDSSRIIGNFDVGDGATVKIAGTNSVRGELTISDGANLQTQDANATLSVVTLSVVSSEFVASNAITIDSLQLSQNSTLIENAGESLNHVSLDNSTFTQNGGDAESLELKNNSTATLAGTISGAVNIDATSSAIASASAFTGAAVTNNGDLTLTTGTLSQKISGTGTTKIDGEISTNANNVDMTFKTLDDSVVTLTAGTLENTITGTGKTRIAGTVSSTAKLLQTPVEVSQTLNLTAGTLSQKISGTGTTAISGEVSANANLLKTTVDVKNGGELTLTAGAVSKTISGAGTLLIDGNVSSSASYLNCETQILDGSTLTISTGTMRGTVFGAGTAKIAGVVQSKPDYFAMPIFNDQTLVLTEGTLTQQISGTGTTKIRGNVNVARNWAFGDNQISIEKGTLTLAGTSINNDITILLSDTYRVTSSNAGTPALAGDGDFAGTLTLSAASTSSNIKTFSSATTSNKYVSSLDEIVVQFALADSASSIANSISVANLALDDVWEDWSIVNYNSGVVTLAYCYDPSAYSAPENLEELYNLLAGTTFFGYQKSTFDARLVELSPVGYGSLVEMQSGFAALANDMLRERLEQRRYEAAGAWQNQNRVITYANAFGQSRDSDGNGIDAANYDIDNYGVTAGIDVLVAPDAMIGFGVAANFATAKTTFGDKNRADSTLLTLSGMKIYDNIFVGFGLNAGVSWMKAKRTANGESFSEKTNGENIGLSLIAGAGYVLSDAAKIDFSPFIGVDFDYSFVHGFNESAPANSQQSAALDVDSFGKFSIRGKVGASLNWRVTDNFRIGFEASFAHNFLDNELDIDAKFSHNSAAGTRKFTSTAYLLDENTYQFGPRLDLALNRNWSLSASYTYESDCDGNVSSHTGNIGARCRF